MVEARSAARRGHWVADADRGAGLTVTGGGALSRVGETSPEVALSALLDWGSTGEQGSEPILPTTPCILIFGGCYRHRPPFAGLSTRQVPRWSLTCTTVDR